MSYFKKILWLLPVTGMLLISCEDTKNGKSPSNTSGVETRDTINAAKTLQPDSSLAKDTLTASKKTIDNTKTTYPKITDENVVSFLTEYGNTHPENKVLITTEYGAIEIELFRDAPLHRSNFLYLVNEKYFDDTFFHRVVPNFIIQGGTSDNAVTQKNRHRIGKDYRIPNEISNGRIHTYGTLSGAKYYRDNDDNKTEPFEFFIFLGPKTSTRHLDGNYTVFAKVTKGMNVVEKIANVPRDEQEWPLVNVTMEARVID